MKCLVEDRLQSLPQKPGVVVVGDDDGDEGFFYEISHFHKGIICIFISPVEISSSL